VIAIKAGRSEAAAKAAHSHTGALAGQDAAYDAVLKRAGILRVRDLEELFDAVATLAYPLPPVRGDLVILTNGGGAGVLATDALSDAGGQLTSLSATTLAQLDAVLPRTWSRGNPVDIIGDAPPQRYADALKILLSAPETNAILVINCPTAIASSVDAAAAVANTAKGGQKTVLANWLGAQSAAEARAQFHAAHVPDYDTPNEAVSGFMHLVRYRKGQKVIAEVPPTLATEFTADEKTARAIITAALARGESWLSPLDATRVLGCYQIPIARAALAASPVETRSIARQFGTAVAVKIVSPDILHKSDAGGVALGLETPDLVEAAAVRMQQHVVQAMPDARIEGFLVQEMIRRPSAYELILGASVDAQFGPVILFGQGGTAAEIIADRALALPPLNFALARELIEETRIARQLKGYRDRPPAAMDDIALTLVKLSQLICDLDEVVELDLNPLLADSTGVIAVDARIRVQKPQGSRGARLAIRPYPRELERQVSLPDSGPMALRPIRPGDAPALATLIGALSPEDARLRFFTPVRSLEAGALARFTQIDYDREMAFVLYPADAPDHLIGVVRMASDPDNVNAEFAIVVRSDCHRRGFGRLLMNNLIGYARTRGLSCLFGDILAENKPMLALCAQLGFRLESKALDVVRAALSLTGSP
jgi:acetyltransferase